MITKLRFVISQIDTSALENGMTLSLVAVILCGGLGSLIGILVGMAIGEHLAYTGGIIGITGGILIGVGSLIGYSISGDGATSLIKQGVRNEGVSGLVGVVSMGGGAVGLVGAFVGGFATVPGDGNILLSAVVGALVGIAVGVVGSSVVGIVVGIGMSLVFRRWEQAHRR